VQQLRVAEVCFATSALMMMVPAAASCFKQNHLLNTDQLALAALAAAPVAPSCRATYTSIESLSETVHGKLHPASNQPVLFIASRSKARKKQLNHVISTDNQQKSVAMANFWTVCVLSARHNLLLLTLRLVCVGFQV